MRDHWFGSGGALLLLLLTTCGGRAAFSSAPDGSGGAGGGASETDGPDAIGVCGGEYLACGCRCCDGDPPILRCYYPEAGEALGPVIAADEASRASPTCRPLSSCKPGTRHVCCLSAPVEPPGRATYAASMYIGGYDRLSITRKLDGGCASLLLMAPWRDTGSEFRLDLPPYWGAPGGTVGACAVAAGTASERPIGALGSIALRPAGTACVLDAHMTVFYASPAGVMRPIRFDADGILVQGSSDGMCR